MRLRLSKRWNITVLFVDSHDVFPASITEATDAVDHMNLMPVYGLNVHSMVKHKTLVLTLRALNELEEKLLFAMHRNDLAQKENASVRFEDSLIK